MSENNDKNKNAWEAAVAAAIRLTELAEKEAKNDGEETLTESEENSQRPADTATDTIDEMASDENIASSSENNVDSDRTSEEKHPEPSPAVEDEEDPTESVSNDEKPNIPAAVPSPIGGEQLKLDLFPDENLPAEEAYEGEESQLGDTVEFAPVPMPITEKTEPEPVEAEASTETEAAPAEEEDDMVPPPNGEDMSPDEKPQGEDISKYNEKNRYADEKAWRRSKRSFRIAIALILISIAVIAASVAAIVFIFEGDHFAPSVPVSIEDAEFGISEEDLSMLSAEGYDGDELTSAAALFMETFFTFDKASVDDGSWQESFEELIAADGLVPIKENILYSRLDGDWAKVFDDHPYYKSKWVSNNSISWNILPTETVNVPYCDVYSAIECSPLDVYFLNSPSLEINRYVNCYRIVFDEDGKITSIKKLRTIQKRASVDKDAMKSDAENAEKAFETQRKKAEQIAKEKAAAAEAEKARKEAEAEAEAKKKAEEEEAKKAAEEAKKKAEEEKKKEEETNKNENSGNENSNSNENGNENSNTGGNTNTNTGPDTTVPDPAPTEPEPAEPASDPTTQSPAAE